MDELYIKQHADVIVGPKHYEQFGPDLLVTNIFYTIQGEGPFAGCPAVFVRLAGCNRGDKEHYGCQFCDTFFAFGKGRRASVEEILHAVEEVRNRNVDPTLYDEPFLVVITGGEPMMQDNVWHLSKALMDRGLRVQIESNGDRLAPGFKDDPLVGLALVVSPKVVAARKGYGQFRLDVMQRATVVKFLLDHREESPYHGIPEPFQKERQLRGKVMVSPVTVYEREVAPGEIASFWTDGMVNKMLTSRNAEYTAHFAMRYGVRVSLQTHLLLSMP